MSAFNASDATVKAAAPAKINLFLHVVGRRGDGRHLLESLVAFAEDGDLVSAAPADELSLALGGPFADSLADDADNLVLRAARALRGCAGMKAGAALRLEKNLPVASGVGGGSADAAATLRALCELWKIRPDSQDLMKIATDLGADVPVCLAGSPAFMAGIGGTLVPIRAFPATPILLVNPLRPVPTGSVFKGLNGRFSAPLHSRLNFTLPDGGLDGLIDMLRRRGNDLTAPAREIEPAVTNVLTAIEGAAGCLLARMSGSGATGFGLFADQAKVDRAAATIRTERPDWWIFSTRLRPSDPESN